jgi:hypothetical protein
MEINKNNLIWFLSGRREMNKKVKGFHAHWSTDVSPNSFFAEYVHLFGGALVASYSVGRFSKIIGARVSHAKTRAFSSLVARCSVAVSGDHPLDQISHHSSFYSPSKQQHPFLRVVVKDKYTGDLKETAIGNYVWIGSDAVVVKNVPPYAVVGGVPAKVIRYRYSPELRDALVESQWWNWPVVALQIIADEFDRDTPLTLERFMQVKEEAPVFLT